MATVFWARVLLIDLSRMEEHEDDHRSTSSEENMLPEFGNAEYLSRTERYVRTPTPSPCSSPTPAIPNVARQPLATIYQSMTANQMLDNARSLPSGTASSMAALALVATVRQRVQQWCYGWGPPRYWQGQLTSGFQAAIQQDRVWTWIEDIQQQAKAGRKMVDAMHDVMDGELPTEHWLYRDLWRQGMELLSSLYEGIACLEAHVELATAFSFVSSTGF